jgi:hypothetical protein
MEALDLGDVLDLDLGDVLDLLTFQQLPFDIMILHYL